MGSPLLLLWLGLAHADCPDVGVSTAEANEALIAAKLDVAESSLKRAEQGFACGSPPPLEALARFWLAEAAVASVTGHDQDARDAWQAAARLAPQLWEPRYGSDLRGKRDAAVAAMGEGLGTLRVEPLPAKHDLLVDGIRTPNPTPVSEGLHVVQVSRRDVVYGRVVLLGADEDTQVRPVLAAEEEDKAPRGRKITLIAGGGLSVAAGAGLLVVAARQDAPMGTAAADWRAGDLSSEEADALVERHWRVQAATGSAGYALTAVGLAGVGIGIMW